jgi:DNA gyrase subunit A
MGRATQGVTLIGLDDGSKLSGLQRIVENDASLDASDPAADTEGDEGTDGATGSAD